MQVITVESTALATVGYDEARERLQVEFGGRTIYHYLGVPAAVYQGLLTALSKGSYFNQAIRGRYPVAHGGPPATPGIQVGQPDNDQTRRDDRAAPPGVAPVPAGLHRLAAPRPRLARARSRRLRPRPVG